MTLTKPKSKQLIANEYYCIYYIIFILDNIIFFRVQQLLDIGTMSYMQTKIISFCLFLV